MFIDIYQQFDSTAHTAHTTDLYFYAALTQLEMAAEIIFYVSCKKMLVRILLQILKLIQ